MLDQKKEGSPVTGEEGSPVMGEEGSPVTGEEGSPVTGEEGTPGRVEEEGNPGRVEEGNPGKAEGGTLQKVEEDTPGREEGDRGWIQGVHHQTLCLGEEVRPHIIPVSTRSSTQQQLLVCYEHTRTIPSLRGCFIKLMSNMSYFRSLFTEPIPQSCFTLNSFIVSLQGFKMEGRSTT